MKKTARIIFYINKNVTAFLDDDINKMFDWLQRKTPLEYEYGKKIVDIPATEFLHLVTSQNIKYYGLKNGIANLQKVMEKGECDIAIHLHQKNDYLMPGGMVTSFTFDSTFPNTVLIELCVTTMKDETNFVIFMELIHEMMHAFCKFGFMAGAQRSIDEMDITNVDGKPVPYYKNGEVEALDGNFAHTLNNLAVWWSRMPIGKIPGSRVMVFGMKGDDVKKLQSDLKTLGFFTFGISTGNFGSYTKTAVINFQKANKLKPDGIVGDRTKEAIDLALKKNLIP